MGDLAIYLKMNFNVPIHHLKDVIPDEEHLVKLKNFPPLFEGATHRTIESDIRNNTVIEGYTIVDQVFLNHDNYRKNNPRNSKREMKYFSVEDLNKD